MNREKFIIVFFFFFELECDGIFVIFACNSYDGIRPIIHRALCRLVPLEVDSLDAFDRRINYFSILFALTKNKETLMFDEKNN